MSKALPLDGRATATIAALALVIVTALVALSADYRQLELIDRVIAGEDVAAAELEESDDRVGATAGGQSAALVLAAIVFLFWFHRAYANVIALGLVKPRYKPGWALAYWLIPIVSLFRPKQVMNDIWRAGDPEPAPPLGPDIHSREVSPLLHWWWAFFIFSVFMGNLAFSRSFEDDNSPEGLRSEAVSYLITDIADIVAAVLAILVVRATTSRVEARRSRWGNQAAPTPLAE